MKLHAALISVKRISTSNSKREDFDLQIIETLAKAILKSEGLIKPMIVMGHMVLDEEGGIPDMSYTLLEGDLQYWACVRAKEIDPRKGEMQDAYVLCDEIRLKTEDAGREGRDEGVREQMEIFQNLSSTQSAQPAPRKESKIAPMQSDTLYHLSQLVA